MNKVYNSHEFIENKISKIVPQMRYDNIIDFEEWRKSALKKLEELLEINAEACEDDFRIISEKMRECGKQIDFEFQSEKNYYIKGSIIVPQKVNDVVAPAFICLQGHSTGRHISLGEEKFERDKASIQGGRDFAVQAAKNGFCAIAIDQRYMGESGQNEDGIPACNAIGNLNASMASLLIGRNAIGERVYDVKRLIDIIEKYFCKYVDVNNIMCMGNSGGGTASFYAAALDERIKGVIPSCGVCTYEKSIVELVHCPCNYIPGIRKYFDMGDIGMLIAPRKLLVVCGTEDEFFPIEGVEETFERIRIAYKKFGKEKNCYLIKGQGGHRFYPEEAWSKFIEMLYD